jgi:dTDP-4-amino-4,6-dideoxygalactose transaminase
MIKFLDLHAQYLSIEKDINVAISSVIKDSAYIGGKYVKQFEMDFSQYLNANYCVGVGNGTDALEIAIEALKLPLGSEIVVPANSFISSAEAVTRSGHKVVFCDTNEDDYTINIEDLEKRITPNTAAIIAVHLYGHPCDMDALIGVAKKHDLKIIEDCAQAHGAEYKGRKVGCIGDVGCFSFYPGKNLGAYGDGGAIVTNNEDLAIQCRMIANHGRVAKYDHMFEGRNSRLDGMQSAVLSVKLQHLDSWTDHRIRVAELYLEELSGVSEIVLPVKQEWARQAYHLFVIRHSDRERFVTECTNAELSTGIHYPIALPKLKAFEYLDQSKEQGYSWTQDANLLSLPIGDHIDLNQLKSTLEQVLT